MLAGGNRPDTIPGAVAGYWARLQARPGFQAAKASQVARAPEGAGAFLS